MYFILRCVILFNMGHICKICKKYGQLFTTRSFTDSTMYPQQPTPAEFRPLLNLRETIMHICRQQHTLYKDKEIYFVFLIYIDFKSHL